MTDKETKNALELCENDTEYCSVCPYVTKGCVNHMCADALALINRQQAEIERLEKENVAQSYKEIPVSMERIFKIGCESAIVKKIEAEAVKEFAERLCEDRLSNDPVVIAVKVELKEMVGEGDEIRR